MNQKIDRQKYLSQTEIIETYQIGIRALKQTIQANQIPVVKKDVDLGLFAVKALYVRKEDIEKLNLEKR